ncbi:MAG: response regulator [Xanthomonadaceae bacterium]|nr:response regulator [Xanthomonadaceae bacterium]MDE2257554.1 response regulator [Xanthomonadaceae bacterium]
MTFNFTEGIADKSEQGLREILLSQAKIRFAVAVPVILTDVVLYFVLHDAVPLWFLALTVGYALYAAIPFLLTRRASVTRLQGLLIGSAISDPLVLSIWIVLTGQFGSVIAGFYLFTTLGFGFRTGRSLMYLCQIVSVAGFTLVLTFTPYWQQHTVFWIALLIPTIFVPFYAGTLIERLREAREHAERQSRAKSDLLAKVSHELRTPLTGIMATTELLSIENSDHAVRRRTDTILSLSETLLSEINDLLDEAKYSSSGIHLSRTPIDLRQRIESLSETFGTMANRKGLTFKARIDPVLASTVRLDGHHLDRILLNLIGNAIKFTETGGVEMSVEIVAQMPSSYRLRFAITDTGIGIPEDFHQKLFQPFTQVDQGSTRRYGGTGLGLALSRKIVEAMGGDLRVESEIGKGSRFWFELDLERCAALSVDSPAHPNETRPAAMRILVVEDNRTSSALIRELLLLDGHQVEVCDSGIAALERLTRDSFDVLLLDYNLGDMDGVQVLRTYRFGRVDAVPALFLTADATAQTSARLLEAGAAGIVYKPVTRSSLRDALARLSDRGTAAASPTAFAPAATEVARLDRPVLRVVPVSALDEDTLDELRGLNAINAGFLRKLLAQAEIDITRACQQLSDAFANRSYAIVPNVAHALKGVSATVGAIRLATLAGALLQMSSDELEADGDHLAADLRECSRITVVALRQAISDSGASGTSAGTLHLN